MSSILSSVPVFTNPEDYQRYLAVRNQDVTGMGTKLAEDFNAKLSQYPNITPVQQFQAFENFKNDYKPYYLRQGYTEDQINKIFSEYDNLADPRNKEGFWGQAKGLGNQFLAGWEKTVGNMQAAFNPDYAEDNMKAYEEREKQIGDNAQIAKYLQQREQAQHQQQGDSEFLATLKSYFSNPRALVGGFTEEVAPQVAMTLPAVAAAPFTGGTSLGAVAAAALASQGAVAEAGNFRLAMKDKINSLSDEQLLKLPQIQERMAQGMSLSEAKADFSTDFSDHAFGTGIAAGLGGLEGFSGLGKFGVSKGVTGALKTLVKEPVLQGVQEGAAQLNQNWWASNLDPNVKLGDDVGSSAALGMLFGAPIGTASAISQLRGGTQSPQQQAQQQSNAIINGLTGQNPQPTVAPNAQPTTPNAQPTVTPNVQPAVQPTTQPATPTAQPTPAAQPTVQPTATPTTQPAVQPTVQPNPTQAVQQSVTSNTQPTVQPIQSLFQPTTRPTTPNAQPVQQNTTPVAQQVEETTAKTKITRNDIIAKGNEQGFDFNKWFEYKNELKATAKERAKSLGVKDYSKADPEGYAELNAELAQDYGFNQRDLKNYSYNYRKIKRDLENQAKSAVENSVDNVQPDAQNNQSSDSLRFSLNESNDSPFAKAVDTVAQGGNVNGYVNVGTTPSVLKMLGLPDASVYISPVVLHKVMQGKHNVTPDTLKQLPQQINNPVAVMKSDSNSSNPDGYVVLTELLENENGKDKPVIAALHLKRNNQGLELINIASVYGRSHSQIQRGIENNLLYLNKTKGSHLVNRLGLQLSPGFDSNTNLSARNVKTETDLSQYQNPQSEQNIETNANPQLTQDRASLSRILGEDTVQHIELIDSNTQKPTGQDVKQLVSEGVEGWFDRRTQKIYLLSDGIEARWGLTREERLAWVAWHELAHAGVNVKYGNKLNTLLETAGKNKLVAAIARRIQREQGYNKHVALEEALVEIYAAHETGNWHSLETRYNITINERWRSGKDNVGDFATKMANYFRRLINVILGKNAMAETMPTSDVFKALHGVSEGIANLSKQRTQTKSDGVRFSLNESHNSDFAKAVDKVKIGKVRNKFVNMGTTPDVLKMLGLPDANIRISDEVIEKAIANTLTKTVIKHRHPHSLTAEQMKALPKELNNPVAVMKSSVTSTNPNGYVMLTELMEEENGKQKPVIAALDLKRIGDNLEVVNIASVHGRNNSQIQRMLNDDLLYWNSEKGRSLVDAVGLSLPRRVTTSNDLSANDIKTETDLSQYQAENSVKNDDSENSVDLENGEGSDVRFSRSESLSRADYDQAKENGETELDFNQWKQVRSPEFKRWFGDWENDPDNASKVVNPRTGEPLVVYHGTTRGGFVKFNPRASRKVKAEKGFFFTDNYDLALQFAGNETTDLDFEGFFKDVDFDEVDSTLQDDGDDIEVQLKDGAYAIITKDDGLYQVYVNDWGSEKEFDFDSLEEMKNYIGDDSYVYSAFLNIKNPEIYSGNEYSLDELSAKTLSHSPNSDGQIWTDTKDSYHYNAYQQNREISGTQYIAFEPNQIKSATDNNGDFSSENDDIRFSRKAPKQDTPYQRDLMVTHNISAKGIMHAKKMGGLPFASVAVAKQSNPLTGFGEVTLIGDRDYIDPKGANKAKVFGADIYSPRYPSVIYDMKDSDLQAIYRQFEESAERLGDNSFQYNVTQNAKRDGLVNVLEDAKPVQYQFLKDNGIDVELVYQMKEHSYSRRESVKNALEKYQGNLNQMRFDKSFAKAFLEEELTLNQKRVALFQARNDQAKADMYSGVVSELNQELSKGDVTNSEHFKSAVNEIIESQQPTDNIDTYKTGLNIREAIKPHKQAFDEYVQEIANTVPVEEKLDNGETRSGTRKYIPHTIENVVKKLKKDLKGGEVFHYGLPSIRAKITPKFKSIQDIQQNKHRLVSNDDFQKIRDELNSDKDKLAEDLGIGSLDIDNLLWNTVDENVSSAFHYADVADTPTNRQLVADFLGKLEAMPTEYFEGKAKDVTQFSDFSGAVIPNNLPKNAYDVLQQAGLKIYEYDPDVETSRAEIIKQATNELDEQSGGNILFSRAKPRSTDVDFENATPKRTANSFAQVKELAKAFLNKTLHNDETGIDAVISRANLEKMLSGKAHAKSTSLHDHLLAVANVDSLFKNAIHGWTEPYNKNDSPDVVGVHKMFAPLNIDGNVKLVKLTVKELKPEQGNRVYSVETIEIGNEKAPVPEMAELGFDSNSHRLHEGSGSNANVQSLIQRIQDFNSRDENSDIRYSKKQSAANLAQTGKAQAEPSILDDLKARDFDALKKRLNQATGKVDEWIADSLRPVNDWIDTFKTNGINEMESEGLKQDMYRAKGVRDALNSEFEQHYLKPLMQKVAQIAKKNKLDELTAKRMVGFWMSTRYAIEKNNELLTREHQAMLDAKKAWDDAIVQGVGVKKAENAYLEAEQQYLDRKHDVELALNSTADFKVGTAGGWSNAEAADIMQNIEKHIPHNELMEAAKYIYRLNQARLKIDFESGRYTAAEFNEYSKNTHYVPLTGDPNQVNDFDGISGAGQNSLNITKDRALNGRKLSEAEDAIDASWRAIGRSTTYKGWADFKTRLDDLYESRVAELKNQGYSHQAAVEETEKTLGISKQEMQGTTRTSDNALIRKQGGKYYEYRLPDKVMTALKNDNVEHANAFLNLISKPTSWYARGVTQWTVTFAPMNMMRDTWEKSEFIRVQKLFDANGKQLDSKTMASIGRAVLKNAFLDKGVWNATKRFGFGESLTHAGNDAKLLKELLDLGGVSTYSTYLAKTETDLIKQIKQENSALGKRLEKAGSLLEGYNKTFDTVSALAAYKAMIEHGVDPKQAAATTLELTNFRKTGSKMRGIKALYMFSQPTAMGARNLIKYLSTSTGRKRFVGYMAVMIPLYLTLRAFDDEDEGGNKMDQLGDITRYIPIPAGLGHYLKIPVGFGMPQLAWNFATNIVKAAVGDISYSDALVNMAVHSSKTIAPISPSEIPASKHLGAKAALTATPTILQPLMQIVLDRTAFGSKLTPGFVVDNKLKAEQSKSTTAKFWKDTALFLSDTLGIDMHPEQIKNLFDGYGSVLGSFKELQTILIENPNREQLGRRTKIPFLNQFIGTTNEFSIQSRYYEAAEEARNLANEYKSRKERGNLQGWATPEIRQKVRFHELAEKRMTELRAKKAKLTKALNAHQLSDTAYNARLKGYNKQVDGLQRVLLKRWRKMEGLNTTE